MCVLAFLLKMELGSVYRGCNPVHRNTAHFCSFGKNYQLPLTPKVTLKVVVNVDSTEQTAAIVKDWASSYSSSGNREMPAFGKWLCSDLPA